jgi:hypothetical protein
MNYKDPFDDVMEYLTYLDTLANEELTALDRYEIDFKIDRLRMKLDDSKVRNMMDHDVAM